MCLKLKSSGQTKLDKILIIIFKYFKYGSGVLGCWLMGSEDELCGF
jgi:hypothetical protein